MGVDRIFHIAEPSAWRSAQDSGSYTRSTRGASLSEVGFIHCSFVHQVTTVANRLYGDWREGLLLLEACPDEIPAEVRVEPLDGGGEVFPHVYGPLPPEAVKAVHRLLRGADRWYLPAALSPPGD